MCNKCVREHKDRCISINIVGVFMVVVINAPLPNLHICSVQLMLNVTFQSPIIYEVYKHVSPLPFPFGCPHIHIS